MASVLQSEIRRCAGSLSLSATCKPSKIPVRCSRSSDSASDDSDNSSKLALKTKSKGKSKLPVPVKTPAKEVAPPAKPTRVTGIKALLEKSQQRKASNGGVQQNATSTPKSNIKPKSKVGGAREKAATKATIKPQPRLDTSGPIKLSPSANQARGKILSGIQKKQEPINASRRLAPVQQQRPLKSGKTGSKAKKGNGLPEEEQEKSFGGIARKTSFRNLSVNGQNHKSEKLPEKASRNTGLKNQEGDSPSVSNKDSKTSNSSDTKPAKKITSKEVSGLGAGHGSVAGGSGDGDPNDPRKPKPVKEPDDKKDEDDEQEKHKTAKKILVNQVIRITNSLLQKEYQSLEVPPVKGETEEEKARTEEIAVDAPLSECSLQANIASQEVKASQNDTEGNIEALQKTILSKDKQIALMQNLVDCCRKDYEELQESFNKYTKDFTQVDENRAKISLLTNEKAILKQENLKLKKQVFQKTTEVTEAQEKTKHCMKNISKLEVHLDFLETEKKELYKKLKFYETNSQAKTDTQKAAEPQKIETPIDPLQHGLGRTCSLQDVEITKIEEENIALKTKLEQCEASLKTQKKDCTELKEKLTKEAQKEDQLKAEIERLAKENDILNSKCGQLIKQSKEVAIEERIEESFSDSFFDGYLQERIEELRNLQADISEAREELVTENGLETGLNGPSSSPLSIELAEVDNFSLQQQPEVRHSSELQTLIHSITAMTEEIREEISKNKVKLAKAYANSDYSKRADKSDERVRELNDEIAGLHEKLEENAARFQTLECLISSSNVESARLRETIEQMEKQLSFTKEDLDQTIAFKNREINNLRRDIQTKDEKLDSMVSNIQLLLDGNDNLRSVLASQNLKLDKKLSEEIEFKACIKELEDENDKLRKQLSKEQKNLKNAQLENDKRQAYPCEYIKNLHDTLQNKIDSMMDVLNSVDRIVANDPWIQGHPCMPAMENGMQILYDVSGLLNSVRDFGSSSSEEPLQSTGSHEQEHEQELEIMLEHLKEEVKNLKDENLKLERKLKEKRVRFAEDTKGDKADEIRLLREQLQEREMQLEQMEEQMVILQAQNDNITQFLGEVREQAIKDTDVYRLQVEGHLNRIEALQDDCDKQSNYVKILNKDLSEYRKNNEALNKKLKTMATEKQSLEQKLEVFRQDTQIKDLSEYRQKNEELNKKLKEMAAEKQTLEQNLETLRQDAQKEDLSEYKQKNDALNKKLKEMAEEKRALEQKLETFRKDTQKGKDKRKDGTEDSVSSTTSMSDGTKERMKELQEYNDELNEKLEIYGAFFDQVKQEKEESFKAIETTRQNAMMMRKKSDEQMAELEQKLEDKDVLEAKLQNTITFLEKRISTLEAEKAESEKQIKAMVESLQGENELEKCKKEWKQLELELQNSILALTSEKADAQKELDEQKAAMLLASESTEFCMKELDECLKDREVLQEELACLKKMHLKEKEERELLRKEKKKMNEEIRERETEVKLLRKSSSEIINELEMQLQGLQHSEMELQERAKALSQQVIHFEEEKTKSDEKIQTLMESIDAKEKLANRLKNDQGNELQEKLSDMKVTMSELCKEKKSAEQNARDEIMLVKKESEEKITALEKRLQDQSDSETMLQDKVQFLEDRISQLIAEKTEREENMKTLMEAMNAKKNLEEHLKKKEEVEEQLVAKVNDMKLKFSRIRSTKKQLEYQLAQTRSQSFSTSPMTKHQPLNLKDEEFPERKKELTGCIGKLSDERPTTEKILQERQSEVLLVKKTSDQKIESLENKLRLKSHSEQELREKMTLLEHKISRLQTEKAQHNTTISSIIKTLKTKEDLCNAIKARDRAEEEYTVKLDEMEVIVNKLRKEKNKPNCDEELKEKYKKEYDESRRSVRRLTENVNRCNERVVELQTLISGSADDEEHKHEAQNFNLDKNIEDLKSSLNASDIELFKTLQSLNEKIIKLEHEKAEGEKMVAAVLRSMDDKEKIEHCMQATRDADNKLLQQMTEMAEAVQRLRIDKQRVEQELKNSENVMAANKCQSERLQNETNEKISSLQYSLEERYETEKQLQERLKSMNKRLARMENEKQQANKTIQTMLESLRWKEKLERCLEEKKEIEKELKRRVHELKSENKEALMEARKYQVQSREIDKLKEKIKLLKEKILQMDCNEQNAKETIRLMRESLQAKDEQTETVERKLKDEIMDLQLRTKDAEIEAKKCQIQSRDAYEIIEQQSREFDERLRERDESSNRLVEEIEKLKESLAMAEKENENLERKSKKYEKLSEERGQKLDESKQCEVNLLKRLSDEEKTIEELRKDKLQIEAELKQTGKEKREATNGDRIKIKLLSNTLQQHYDQEKDLKHTIDSLVKQITILEEEKETTILENSKVVENLNMELAIQCNWEIQFKEQLGILENERQQLKAELEQQARREADVHEEKETEIQKLKSETMKLIRESQAKDEQMETIERKLKDEIMDLQLRTKDAEMEAKKCQIQSRDAYEIIEQQSREFDERLREREESSNRLVEEIEKLKESLAMAEKENFEGSKVVENLNMELAIQCDHDIELKEQLGILENEAQQLRAELEQQARREADVREEKETEIQKLKSENETLSETMRKEISAINREIMKHITKENDLRLQIESARFEKEKLLLEVDELKTHNVSSTRASRKLIEEMKENEKELVDKIEELKLTIKTLEGENRRVTMKYKDYQSEIANMTQTSRNTIHRLNEDLKNQCDNNNHLQNQLTEMRLNGNGTCSCCDRRMQEQKEENEKKIKYLTSRIRKQKNEITRLTDREKNFKEQIMELKLRISGLEDRKVHDDAERRSQHHELICESKKANANIQELHHHINQRYQLENKLRAEIESLKDTITNLKAKIKSQQLENAEISKLHSFSKENITELKDHIEEKDEQIQRLKSCSEELRIQVLSLQKEKKDASNSLENYQLLGNQRNVEIEILEGKLRDQEDILNRYKIRNAQLMKQRDGLMANSNKEARTNSFQDRQIKDRAYQAMRDSISDSERTFRTLESNWQFLEKLKNRKRFTDDSYNQSSTYAGSYRASTLLTSNAI